MYCVEFKKTAEQNVAEIIKGATFLIINKKIK